VLKNKKAGTQLHVL